MKLTIGIKALNEENRIERALQSAVAAATPYNGEIILADSGSTDATLEIASRYPVTIVQFSNLAERSCGAGAQLAFQHARGEFFYILDGDMELHPNFLTEAIPFLENHPEFAAVGGHVEEINASNHEFKVRREALKGSHIYYPACVDRLDCGGLYRTSAIKQVGYFSDRNLHSFEEFELASRLISKGWRLTRLNIPAVKHFGHVISSYHLMRRRIATKHTNGPGEVLRGAVGREHFGNVVRNLSQLRNGFLTMLWWVLLLVVLILSVSSLKLAFVLALLVLVPIAFLVLRRKSLSGGIFSFISWNFVAAGIWAGFFSQRHRPDAPIDAKVLKSYPSGSVRLPLMADLGKGDRTGLPEAFCFKSGH